MTNCRVFIRHLGSENSPAKFQSSVKELCSLKNHSPVTLHYSPAISNINENPETASSLAAKTFLKE